MRSRAPRRTTPSLTRWPRNRLTTSPARVSRAATVCARSGPVPRSAQTAWLSSGGNRAAASKICGSRSAMRRAREGGSSRRASRASDCIKEDGQAEASRAIRQATTTATLTWRKGRRPIMGAILLQGLGFQTDLSVLGLQAEAHGLCALLTEDAVGLLRDQLAEPF